MIPEQAILKLIADLYTQVAAGAAENAQLRAALAEKQQEGTPVPTQ